MVWSIGNPGDQSSWSLESWSKGTVILLPNAFAMLTFILVILVKLAIMAINFFLISKFWGLWGVLRLCYVWDLLLATSVSCDGHSN